MTKMRWDRVRPEPSEDEEPFISKPRAIIRAKYKSSCEDCQEPIEVGQLIRPSLFFPGHWCHVHEDEEQIREDRRKIGLW